MRQSTALASAKLDSTASPSTEGDARFERDMRSAFGGPRASAARLRELRFGRFSVVDLDCPTPGYGRSAPMPVQDALLVSLQLRTNTAYDMWEDGKRLDCLPVQRGMVNLNDLRSEVVSASAQPFHALAFTLPVRAADDWDESGKDLNPGRARTGLHDPVIHGLGMALFPALDHPERASHAFIEYVLLALRAHLVHRFGAPLLAPSGGLSRSQLERVKSFLEARLAENLSLTELAQSCSLSTAHFARAFRVSTGVPPHRFLMERRVARARELLVHSRLPLSEVALRCGFADQSHLTKACRRVLGVTPGKLRPLR